MNTYQKQTFARRGHTADRIAAQKRLRQGAHNLVLEVQGERSTRQVASTVARMAAQIEAWWVDLRRGRNTVYGSLIRFLDVAISLGVSRETLLRVPGFLEWYINDQCDERDGKPPKPLKLVA